MREGMNLHSVYGKEDDGVVRNESAEVARGRAANVIINGWADKFQQQFEAKTFIEEAATLELKQVINKALEQARSSHRETPGDPMADKFVQALAIELIDDVNRATITGNAAVDNRIKQEVLDILGHEAYGKQRKG